MTLMVRNVYIQICVAKSFEFCNVGSASMLKKLYKVAVDQDRLVYLFNKCCNQSTQHIFIKNKATCFGHKRKAIFRPELFLMKICCVE